MSAHNDDSKHISLSLGELDRLCPVAKALSSPMRVKMISLLSLRPMNVNELADALALPVSTAALNVRQLEEAGLISTEIQPGIRGAMKLCSRRIDSVSMRLTPDMQDGVNALTLQLPIGSYSAAEGITPECGMVSDHAWIGESNAPRTFYHPDRFRAQMLWFQSGELEYRFSLGEVDPSMVSWIECSMEISSNAPMYREHFKSDIFVSVNGVTLGTWVSPGDYGGRRGRLNPSWWSDTSSQFGLLKTWRVDMSGTTLDGDPLSGVALHDLSLDSKQYISLRVGVRPDAQHVGGLNLFGDKFGDFAQGIVMRIGYEKPE
ncbi:MAG: helix-turn-helix domain-containing protein [Clostridia bacterium]|nr:helix-turn-helix domain-containing protein [Clostridia bacterium]